MNKKPTQSLREAYVIGTGHYVPERVLTNQDLEKMVDTSDEWITTRTGIKTRYICADGEGVSRMSEMASRKALEMAVAVARPDDVKALNKKFLDDYKKDAAFADKFAVRFLNSLSKLVASTPLNPPATNGNVKLIFSKWGTPGLTMFSGMTADTPVKNWGGTPTTDFTFERIEKLAGETVVKRQKRRYACQACPLGCGGHMKAGTEYKYPAGAHKPEYESLGMFGPNLLNDNLESIIMANDLCNRAGLDTISTACTVLV